MSGYIQHLIREAEDELAKKDPSDPYNAYYHGVIETLKKLEPHIPNIQTGDGIYVAVVRGDHKVYSVDELSVLDFKEADRAAELLLKLKAGYQACGQYDWRERMAWVG